MPSLQDNSPNAVYECLEHGIPFIANDVGGVAELIAPDDRARVLVDPSPASLEAALRRVLCGHTVPQPARAAVAGAESLQRWAEVVEQGPAPRVADREPDAVDVVVDRKEAASVGDTPAPFVLLLDRDDVPEPELLEALVRAQTRTGADVVTCGLRIRDDDGADTVHFFSGDAGGLGALSNVYGTVALIRRTLLEGLENLWPTGGDPHWPLLARLVADGARIVSIPAPLVTRRTSPGSIERNPSDALFVAQQLERALPEPLRATARLVGGLASPR
jgi:hypothetical protein